MIKKFLTVLLFVLITSPAFSAGSSGGSSGDGAKPVSQYPVSYTHLTLPTSDLV